jgi:phytoene dehydrogenase-like protein
MILQDELGLLSSYGLEYLRPDLLAAAPLKDGRAIRIYRDVERTCASLAELSPHDARAYRELYEIMLPGLEPMLAMLFNPPLALSTLFSLMEAAPAGAAALRFFLCPARDVIESYFENDAIRAFLSKWASEFMRAPQQPGSGAFFLSLPLYHRFGVGLPVGGSGALSEALARCVLDSGGEIWTGTAVAKISVEGGKARAVVLDTGEELEAERAVIATVNVKQLYLEMLRGNVPDDLAHTVTGIAQCDFVRYKVHVALSGLPTSPSVDLLSGGFHELTGSYREVLDGFQALMIGRLPDPPLGTTGFPTVLDPSRAPEGKHILWFEGYAPSKLRERSWDEAREDVTQKTMRFLEGFYGGLEESTIVGVEIDTPEDMERFDPSFLGGDIMHIRGDLSQSLSLRPFPGFAPYRTPFPNLYLCGASTHPGGGVSGGSRAAVRVILGELGINPSKVMVAG